MEKDDGSITTSSCTSSDRSAIGVSSIGTSATEASAIIASASVATRIGIVSIEAGESGLSRVVLPRIDMETLKNLPTSPWIHPLFIDASVTLAQIGIDFPMCDHSSICQMAASNSVPVYGSVSWDGVPPSEIVSAACRDIKLFFEGELDPGKLWFDYPLKLPAGSDFAREVMVGMTRIAPGRVTAYGALAAAAGRPRAARATGAIVGANPLPLVVPCHRVVGVGGRLTGYGGGLPLKVALLAMEQTIINRTGVLG